MAISGQLTVTPEELEVQARNVNTVTDDLQESFNRIKKLIADTENYWKGDAANAHREGYHKNQESIEEIIARYREHVKDLEKMAGIYREAETAATNMADELPTITL